MHTFEISRFLSSLQAFLYRFLSSIFHDMSDNSLTVLLPHHSYHDSHGFVPIIDAVPQACISRLAASLRLAFDRLLMKLRRKSTRHGLPLLISDCITNDPEYSHYYEYLNEVP